LYFQFVLPVFQTPPHFHRTYNSAFLP
jgi:hypothetical protein